MAVYRNISMDFWTDSKVVDDFTPEDRYFHIYVLTNPHTNLCGCYEVSLKQIANETGYNTDTVLRLLDRFQNVHKTLEYCKETKEILILNWFKYNWTASPKLDKPLLKDIQHLFPCLHLILYKYYIIIFLKSQMRNLKQDSSLIINQYS